MGGVFPVTNFLWVGWINTFKEGKNYTCVFFFATTKFACWSRDAQSTTAVWEDGRLAWIQTRLDPSADIGNKSNDSPNLQTTLENDSLRGYTASFLFASSYIFFLIFISTKRTKQIGVIFNTYAYIFFPPCRLYWKAAWRKQSPTRIVDTEWRNHETQAKEIKLKRYTCTAYGYFKSEKHGSICSVTRSKACPQSHVQGKWEEVENFAAHR